MSYIIFCILELLSPKDLTRIKHILNVEKGNGPQNPIRIAKNIKYSLQDLIEKKNTQKHYELNVDRDGIKGGSCEDSLSGQILAQIHRQKAECLVFFCF